MGLVALFAVDIAALRSVGGLWVDACRLLTASVLVFATFRAKDRRGGDGAFWFGFAVLGWAAFVLGLEGLGALGDESESAIVRLLFVLVEETVDPAQYGNGPAAFTRVLRQLQILRLMLILPAGLAGGFAYSLADRRGRRAGEAA